jgi:hypothetical protein
MSPSGFFLQLAAKSLKDALPEPEYVLRPLSSQWNFRKNHGEMKSHFSR